MSMVQMFDAFLAAAKLPAVDDTAAWRRLAEMWRKNEHGEAEAVDIAARIEELEEENGELADKLEEVEAECTDLREQLREETNERQILGRDRATLQAMNESLRKAIDKFSMTVPAVAVGQVLRDIVARCDEKIPVDVGMGDFGRTGPDERWHALLRMIRNDAKRALEAMKPGE